MSITQESKNFKTFSKIEQTDDALTSRAGLGPISEFVKKLGISHVLAELHSTKKNQKGASDEEIYHQTIMSFIDGTYHDLTGFDHLKKQATWSDICGVEPDHVISSHSLKRFFSQMSPETASECRAILLALFRKSLKSHQGTAIILDVDSVVFDNDCALLREGCTPTYKKVKGYQPLLVKWNNQVVWADFREGSIHCNHGHGVLHALATLQNIALEVLGPTAHITVTFDSGFFDQKIFRHLEAHKMYYVCSGKIFSDIREKIDQTSAESYQPFTTSNTDGVWEYVEFSDQRSSWDIERRAIFTRRIRTVDGQHELIGPDAIYYTNVQMPAKEVIALAHSRGAAELVHRKLKDFSSEQLPFQAFRKNEVWFFLMLISFTVFELFKAGCPSDEAIAAMYPTTFRRRYFDIAGKIVRHAGEKILKVANDTFNRLQMMWKVQIDFDYS